jgi:hypothetical protein
LAASAALETGGSPNSTGRSTIDVFGISLYR